MKFSSLCIASLTLAVSWSVPACRAATGDARRQIGQLNVPYSADAFVARAGSGDTAAVRLFIDAGMSVDSVDASGSTALIAAASDGHVDIVTLLLARGAAVALVNDEGLTALGAASSTANLQVVRTLLDKGASVAISGTADQSPLMRAIRAGRNDVVTLLLDKGAPAGTKDEHWSALMMAAFMGNTPVVNALIAHGADVNAANGRGMTALMHAAGLGRAEIAQVLLDKGAAVNAADAAGHTALMFAANNGHADVVALLRDHGANASSTNGAGATASAMAAGNGYQDIVTLLKSVPPVPPARGPDPLQQAARRAMMFPDESASYDAAARRAWRYVEKYSEPTTGLTDAALGYPSTTVWDIGSAVGAMFAAHELGIITSDEYDRRLRRVLGTLYGLELYDGVAFNKVYSTKTGAMTDSDGRTSTRGSGWSGIDMGRLLVWLKIVADAQPQYRDVTSAIVGRLAMNRLVKGGYLRGETVDGAGVSHAYQEGRIGYEQYAALGFHSWGVDAARALRWRENGVPIDIMGRQLLADVRGSDRITSDPFILIGVELGWDHQEAQLADAFMAVQETRYRQTGRVTLVGEDAMPEPPYFFYYYSAFANGKVFALDVQDPHAVIEHPRWVSAKAAWAWQALLPSAYTAVALRGVMPAALPDGWASGVYEAAGSGSSTGALNLNSASVILAAALFHARGQAFLPQTDR